MNKTDHSNEETTLTPGGGALGGSRPELLAPAGDWECARAAVENGADAIYFGLEKFNARMRAHNFTEADLPGLMEYLHVRGVRGYVTFNTLVFAEEMARAEEYLRAMINAGVDAAIVQDIGICRLIRKLSADFPIHASTQMTVTSAAGVEFARDLGCNLVVLARECSLVEIQKIQDAQAVRPGEGAEPGFIGGIAREPLPLEVFVHGALCVAYSGQCLTSESLGGRSANRGECAQACRMPYELISDNRTVPLGDRRYLLSPQDLAGLEVLPDLIRVGVRSLKIEGRLKSAEYVANITKVYREALDEIAPRGETPSSEVVRGKPAEAWYDLEMGFSRGLYTGWFRGINNQELAHARFGKKRGVYLGIVSRIQKGSVLVRLEGPLKAGDGVVFDAGRPDEKEEGGRVYGVRPSGHPGGGEAVISFGDGDINESRIHIGDKLWKTDDPELNRRLRKSFAGTQPHFRRSMNLVVHGEAGKPMTIEARDQVGNVVRVDSGMALVKAENQPLSEERLREQLGRLGGTPFKLGELRNELRGEVLLPMSEMNRIRREAVSQLEALRRKPKRWSLNESLVERPIKAPGASAAESFPRTGVELIVLVRSLPQLEAALRCGVKTLYCDFADPKQYRTAVELVRARKNSGKGPMIYVAPPRIFKPGEEWILKQVRSSEADGYLMRNYDHLKFFEDCRRVGDFSLNVANRLSAEYFKEQFGLERLTASYDLNVAQLEGLLRTAPPEWFEITIHQHMPMFHMEHCVFCAFLSKGTDFRNCGRPCDHHDVRLRDRVGAEHPLKADVGCRNTVFNARAQTGAEYVDRLRGLGVVFFRIEFVDETRESVEQTIQQYGRLLDGRIGGSELWRELKLLNQLGVTRGQMDGSPGK